MKLDYNGWQLILTHIKLNEPVSKTANDVNMTYSHVSKIVHKMAEMGLIELQKEGRQISIEFTTKGFNTRNGLLAAMKEVPIK